MFRRYSLFDNTSPRVSVLAAPPNAVRKNSLGVVPENQQMLPPSKHIAMLLQQQRKTRSLSNSPVYRKKKYDNLPKLIDHYYDYDDNGDIQENQPNDCTHNDGNRNVINDQKVTLPPPSNDDDNPDGIRHSHHVSRHREKIRRNNNLHSFGNSIGVMPHKRLLNDDSGGSAGHSHVSARERSPMQPPQKPLQPLVFATNSAKSPQRSSSPIHSCLLVRRRSEFYDPSFADCPPLLKSLKVGCCLGIERERERADYTLLY